MLKNIILRLFLRSLINSLIGDIYKTIDTLQADLSKQLRERVSPEAAEIVDKAIDKLQKDIQAKLFSLL